MRTIKEHYLARQAHEAREARQKGELRATSSVLRLGIIGKEGESAGGDSGSSSSSGGGSDSESGASKSKDD